MSHKLATAKIFQNGRSQAVRLPLEFRFDTDEVFIRRDPQTGDVILSARPTTWDQLFKAINQNSAPKDFLTHDERNQTETTRDPLEGLN